MAIESPMVHAGPTIKRDQVTLNCIRIASAAPVPGAVIRFFDAPSGLWSGWQATPTGTHSGELLAVIDLGTFRASLYTWIASTETWTQVSLVSEYIDPGTGKAWDPLAKFYTPLAS